MQAGNDIALDALLTCALPVEFASYVILESDITELEPLSANCHLVQDTTRQRKLAYKTLYNGTENAAAAKYGGVVNSLLSTRFFFLAPLQGFTTTAPFRVFFDYYEGARPLKSVEGISGTNKTLIAAFVCYAMAYLEFRQVIHGALHSGNILLDENSMPILTDYGLAQTRDYFSSGSGECVSWVAPELLLGVHANYNVDVYSFGVLLYEMFEGKRPYSEMTNNEYLAALRSGALAKVEFAQTPELARKVIMACMNRNPDSRPSFSEMYFLFINGRILFDGADVETVRAVLGQYPLRLVFQPCINDGEKGESMTAISPREVLANPQHPQFEEYLRFVEPQCTLAMVRPLCGLVAGSVRKEAGESRAVKLILSVLATVGKRLGLTREFLAAVVESRLLSQIFIWDDEQALLLLPLVVPVLTSESDLFTPKVYHAVGQLMIYRPVEMLNLFSAYFSSANINDPRIENNVNLFIGMGSVLAASKHADSYVKIIKYISAESNGQFKSDIVPVLSMCLQSSSDSNATTEATLLLSDLDPTAIQFDSSTLPGLLQSAPWDYIRSLLLTCESIPVVPLLVSRLLQDAQTAQGATSTAILLKYSDSSAAHASSLVTDLSWLAKELPTAQDTYRLFLSVFSWECTRQILAQSENFFVMLKNSAEKGNNELLYSISCVLQRTPMNADSVNRASASGFIRIYLDRTLSSPDFNIVGHGALVAKRIASCGYARELPNATAKMLERLRANSRELGDILLRIFVDLSAHPQCMDILKRAGMVKYYESIQNRPPYDKYARIFLERAKLNAV